MQSVDLKGRPYSRFWFILTLLAATFTMSISQSALSTAYPTLMRYFGINASTVQWLTTGFMLVMCVMMPVSPWLLKNMQLPYLFLTVTGLFDIGTFIIYLAPNFTTMLIGRALEAIAVGVLFPSFQSVLLTITEKEKRGSTMGLAGLVMGSALAVGPIISGIVLRYTTWQGLFVFFMIVISIVFFMGIFLIKDVMPESPGKLDSLSVLLSVGFIGVLYFVNQLPQFAMHAVSLSLILVISILALIWFTYRQLHQEAPMLELRVMRSSQYVAAMFLTAISYVALIVVTIIFPLFYQQQLHLSPFASGMALVPGAVLLSILNPLTGKLADRFGFKWVLLTGMSMIVLGWLILTAIPVVHSIWVMMGIAMLIEGGNAFVMMPAVTLGADSLPTDLISHGTAVITTLRQICGALGVAVATMILATFGYRVVFITFLVIEMIGLILAIQLKGRKHA